MTTTKHPPHIKLSDDSITLTCLKCFASMNTQYAPYEVNLFLKTHEHPPTTPVLPANKPAKPWPSY